MSDTKSKAREEAEKLFDKYWFDLRDRCGFGFKWLHTEDPEIFEELRERHLQMLTEFSEAAEKRGRVAGLREAGNYCVDAAQGSAHLRELAARNWDIKSRLANLIEQQSANSFAREFLGRADSIEAEIQAAERGGAV